MKTNHNQLRTALFAVTVLASLANAQLLISVNGTIDPPDSSITLRPSGTAIIDIHGNGQDPMGVYYLGILVNGPGSFDISRVTIPYPGVGSSVIWNGHYVEIGLIDLVTPPAVPKPLIGLLVDNIIFHCEGPGDVTLLFMNVDGEELDRQVIHQIPEPMTMVLLGLGAMMFRRRRR